MAVPPGGDKPSPRPLGQPPRPPVGITYDTGFQTQPGGPRGCYAKAIDEALADPACPDPLEKFSRMLEQTFRNFQLTARRPSHIDPPKRATVIDVFSTGITTVLAGAVDQVLITTEILPANYLGVIIGFGQSAENSAAWPDLTWRIQKATDRSTVFTGVPPYNSIGIQISSMLDPKAGFTMIQLKGGDSVRVTVSNGGAVDHFVTARLMGWFYPQRINAGDDNIQSTLVD